MGLEDDLSWAVRELYGRVYRFAYRFVGNRETAQDIVQESFLRLAAVAPGLDADGTRRWLFVAARNLCISHLRRDLARAEPSLDAIQPADPESVSVRKELGDSIRGAVAQLPPDQREVVLLREYEDMSYAEISAVLGCAEGTVKSRLARAREHLRVLLGPIREDWK